MRHPQPFFALHRAAPVLTACLAAACGGESDPGPAGDTYAEPRYAIESLIFGDSGRASYVALVPALEPRDTVRLDSAREFAEYSPADPFEESVIVGSGEAPTLTRYRVSDQGTWSEEQTVSFASFTSSPLDTSIYASPTNALVPFDGTNFVVWNPSTFEIVGELGAPPEIPLTRGDVGDLLVRRGYAYALRGATLFQPYYWATADYQAYSELSQISVIDTAENTVTGVLDVPCPHLHITSQDAAGNVYFSNGQGSIASAVLDDARPRNCFARIAAGSTTVDEVVHFRDLTEGREGSNLFLIDEGLALFNVYHAERDEIGPDTEHQTIDYSSSYHLWTLDLETMEARIMDGLDYAGGQFIAVRIDERTFVTIPAADYSSTAVYEVLGSGRAEKLFDVQGWAFKMFRVR